MTLIKNLKRIYQMTIFLAKMFKIYQTLTPQVIYQHILTSLNRVPYLSYNCEQLCDSNKQMDWVCVSKLSGKPCNLQDCSAGPREILIKAERIVR